MALMERDDYELMLRFAERQVQQELWRCQQYAFEKQEMATDCQYVFYHRDNGRVFLKLWTEHNNARFLAEDNRTLVLGEIPLDDGESLTTLGALDLLAFADRLTRVAVGVFSIVKPEGYNLGGALTRSQPNPSELTKEQRNRIGEQQFNVLRAAAMFHHGLTALNRDAHEQCEP